jgi:hypothetical protein
LCSAHHAAEALRHLGRGARDEFGRWVSAPRLAWSWAAPACPVMDALVSANATGAERVMAAERDGRGRRRGYRRGETRERRATALIRRRATGAARDRGESGGSWDITKLAGPNRAVHLDRVHRAPRRGRDRPIGRRAAASGGWTAQVPSLMPSRWCSVTPSAAREARASCVRIRASRCAGQRCRSRCRARRASPSRRQPAGRRRGRRPSGRRTGTPRRPGEPSCPARFRGPQRW